LSFQDLHEIIVSNI